MKKLLILLIIPYIIASCQDKDDCSPASAFMQLLPNKQIVIQRIENYDSDIVTINNGEQLLAQYTYIKTQCNDIYDDEYSEILTFEVDTSLEEFTYVDADIQQTKCFYQEKGAWVRGNTYSINKGLIKGKKIANDQWNIEVYVLTNPLFQDEQPKTIAIKGIFKQ